MIDVESGHVRGFGDAAPSEGWPRLSVRRQIKPPRIIVNTNTQYEIVQSNQLFLHLLPMAEKALIWQRDKPKRHRFG